MRHQNHLIFSGIVAIGLAFLWAGAVFGQSSNQSTVSVNRAGSLSFTTIPSTFDFGSTQAAGVRRAAYTNPVIDEWVANPLTIQDTRGSGGFTVTLSANNDFSDGGSNTIPIRNTSPDDNLRIVTSPSGEAGTNGINYSSGFIGPQTVSAPLDVQVTNGSTFGVETTFLNVANNILDTTTPVVVIDGTLDSASGRIGTMETGVAAMLYIPAFQATGQYTTTLTWTLSDSTT